MLKQFGENVRKYRRINKLTQEQLAELVSTSSVQIGRIECGKNACTINMVIKLCISLGVAPNQLFEGITDMPLNSNTTIVNSFIANNNIQNKEVQAFIKHAVSYFQKGKN